MSIEIYHEPWEVRDPKLQPQSFHLVIEDPPFALAGIDRNILKIRPGWDVAWSPLKAIRSDARLLVPGGWSIRKTSDRLLGVIRDITSGDHANTLTYLEWMWRMGILSSEAYEESIQVTGREFAHLPQFEYKATVTWVKPSGSYLRDTTYLSRTEWFTISKRLDAAGKSVPAPAWQFISVNAMANHFLCPVCSDSERLYWHLVDSYEVDNEVRGTIVPCQDKKACDLCAQGKRRRSHPTQTPRYVWDWFLERHAKKSLRLRDRFTGIGSLARACQLRGIHYIGTEISWEYARVAQMNIGGEFWDPPEPEPEIVQESFFGEET